MSGPEKIPARGSHNSSPPPQRPLRTLLPPRKKVAYREAVEWRKGKPFDEMDSLEIMEAIYNARLVVSSASFWHQHPLPHHCHHYHHSFLHRDPV